MSTPFNSQATEEMPINVLVQIFQDRTGKRIGEVGRGLGGTFYAAKYGTRGTIHGADYKAAVAFVIGED